VQARQLDRPADLGPHDLRADATAAHEQTAFDEVGEGPARRRRRSATARVRALAQASAPGAWDEQAGYAVAHGRAQPAHVGRDDRAAARLRRPVVLKIDPGATVTTRPGSASASAS
jgi:hypothetical protein